MEFNLADLFESVVDAVPDREALVCGERRLTYRELDEAANRLAHGLATLGVGVGDHIGCYLHNSIEHVQVMFACYKLRAVPVNVNYRYVADELGVVMRDADLVALVFDRSLGAEVAGAARPDTLQWLLEVDDGTAERSVADARLLASVLETGMSVRDFGPRSGDDHYVLYTGGTTGLPKGVVWRQEDIFFAAVGGGNPGGPPIERPEELCDKVVANPNQRLAPFLAPGDPGPGEFVTMSLGPLVHASGQWGAFGTLLGGGRLILYPERHMDMTLVLQLVERERIGMLTLVGDASARPLLDAVEANGGAYDTSSLLLLGSGGSILSGDVKDRLLVALPSVQAILEAIGSSESPSQAVALATRDTPVGASLTFAPKAETMVVDDSLTPIDPGSGIAGRLATTGRVPIGYHNDPERSARTFVEIDGRRWALPGDMAMVDADGTIHLLGRGSMCINTGGEKVYPEEVEAVLKAHPKIADAVVVGVSDERWGERVVAVVAPVLAGDPPDLADVDAHCRGRLAGYKVPRGLCVVDEVQRTPAGKPDYRWARQVADA
ncbi:MAG: acyl-CoA synthetase [Acidimicrobiia bacterium]|nr:acyl-CoA synthetase [Acidimicrobiia bacterium]